MNSYKKKVLEARKQILQLTLDQEKQIIDIYNKQATKLIDEILEMPESRTRTHKIDTAKIINEYVKELYENLNDNILKNTWESSYIQRMVILDFVDNVTPNRVISEGLKRSITNISDNAVRTLIAGEYYSDGKTLSKRLWNYTKQNGQDIDTIIKMNIAGGANVRTLATELERYVNPKNRIISTNFKAGLNSYKISYNAQRLARTSITHAATETQIQNAKKNPFSLGLKWNLSASHSARMHGKQDECDDREGKVYEPDKVPLQHPNCLCYFTEEVDEKKAISDIKAWASGDLENKQMDEWFNNFNEKWNGSNKNSNEKSEIRKVVNTKENQLSTITKNTKKAVENTSNLSDDSVDKKGFKGFISKLVSKKESSANTKLKLSELPKDDYKNILDIVNRSPKEFKNKVEKYNDKIIFLNIEAKGRNKYSPADKGIYYNLNRDKNNRHGKGQYTTLFHEIGHLVDRNMGRPSMKSERFRDLIINDATNFINSSKRKLNIEDDDAIYDIIKEELESDNRYHSLADIFGGVTNNKLSIDKFGHDDDYWRLEGSLQRETFAHFFEATIRNDNFKLENFKNILPNAYKEFMGMMKEE